jgi:hypothetical protein
MANGSGVSEEAEAPIRMEDLGIACLRPRLFVKKYIDLTSLPLNPE